MSKKYTVQEVKELVKNSELTQLKFAETVGINRVTLSCILRETYKISKANHVLFAEYERKKNIKSNVNNFTFNELNMDIVAEDPLIYPQPNDQLQPKTKTETILKSLININESLTRIADSLHILSKANR